jgi:carbon storage regulator CsrA
MLVVARKKNEALVIDQHIEVTVVDILPEKIRLGIMCPSWVSVHRKEVTLVLGDRPPPELPVSTRNHVIQSFKSKIEDGIKQGILTQDATAFVEGALMAVLKDCRSSGDGPDTK